MSQFRTYNAGELAPINKSVNQEKGGNFRNDEGVLCLIRCYACGDEDYGRENHMGAVMGGYCAWCGWSEDKLNES